MSEGARAILAEAEEEEEDSGETEVANSSEVPQGSNLAPTNQPLVSQSDPSLFKIMEQRATIMQQLSQAASPRDNSKRPELKNPSMKAPDPLDGTQVHKLTAFIQLCQLIFHNNSEICSLKGRKICTKLSFSLVELANVLSPTFQIFPMNILPTSSIIGIRKAEQELDNLRINESGHVSLYIADLKSLISKIGDWEKRAYIHVYRRELASRPLDQLASYPGNLGTLQELMDITLELDTRYHERQKEKGIHQEKKAPVTGANSSELPQDSSSKRPHHKKNKRGK
ncbi:hypothetical protein O181_050858 [Austropuccinia psidii MF-1]|uniref:Uncharacterized protein n=1 Tax=Austropuccinia psidii MF-1 TaxID=1389203 RepID=A0A9Q3DZV7_9BASI|nr:hypothetical protein [Austropuccinia psidii MF-1]